MKRWMATVGLVAAGVLATPAVAVPVDPAPLTRLDVSGARYALTEHMNAHHTPPAADYEQVGLGSVLTTDATTPVHRLDSPQCAAQVSNLPQATLPTRSGFCWGDELQGVRGATDALPWVPQGIATSGEAQLSGLPIGAANRAAVVSWNWTNQDTDYRHNSVKLAFVNLDDMKYRFVLPVWVDATGAQRRIYGHGGGLAWYGPYLFMSSTGNWNGKDAPTAAREGVRVFDTRKIYKKKDGSGGDYQYVLPEVRHYGSGGASFHFVSLDRNSTGGASLVGGTNKKSQPGGAPDFGGTEFYRYRFGADYRLNTTPVEGWRSTDPQAGATHNAISDAQGVQADGDTLFVSMSKGALTNRRFATVDVAGPAADWKVASRTDWGFRTQDLSLWYDLNKKGTELWSLTEGEEQRVVFSVNVDELR